MNLEQLKTILWLRWRLTCNQLTRSRGVGAVITVLMTAVMLSLVMLGFTLGFFGGTFGLRQAKPAHLMLVWLGITVVFLFVWLIGLVNEIQRSETIDLQRLMHLPVALGQIFLINYLASHLSLSIFLFLPAMMGLAVGLVISRGAAMLLLVPLSLGMVFMITAWTYLLRGWLASLMSNPRRRRTVIMLITFAFIMISQLPNIYFNRFDSGRPRSSAGASRATGPANRRTGGQAQYERLLPLLKFIPPFWLPLGAGALAEGHALPAVLGTLGCFGLGALGLRRAYIGTVRFYQGDTGKRHAAKPEPPRPIETRTGPEARAAASLVELHLPGVPEQAAALAVATFRSMLRAPEVKLTWASSFIVTIIIGATFLLRNPPEVPDPFKPLIATGAVVFSVFMLVQFFANQFGFDRDGFRALVLSPAPRRLILLGKNLACLPAGAVFGVVVLILLSFWLRFSLVVVLAALLQLMALLLLAGLVGNLISILAPYRIQPGSMKPTKMPAVAMLLLVVSHLFFPLAMLPVFVPPAAELLWRFAGWPTLVPVNLLLSGALAALLGFAYWQALEPLGRLLQRRETKILETVTVEVE